MWQLSGIPCVHATKVILYINKTPESYVPPMFKTDMYHSTYNNYMKPVDGIDFWPDQSMYTVVLPPKPRKMPGRPRKKRIRSSSEGGSPKRVSRVGTEMTCSICHQPGHNKKGCKNEPVAQEPKEKKPRGRPRKEKVTEVENIVEGVREIMDPSASHVEIRAGGSNVRPGAKIGPKKKRGAKSVPTKKTCATSGSNRATGVSGGSRRNNLKRSCPSTFARWFGDPEVQETVPMADESEAHPQVVEPEVQEAGPMDDETEAHPQVVEPEVQEAEVQQQVEIELTGTQVEIMQVHESHKISFFCFFG